MMTMYYINHIAVLDTLDVHALSRKVARFIAVALKATWKTTQLKAQRGHDNLGEFVLSI